MKLEVDLLHAQPCLSMPRISADLLYNLPEMSTRKKKSGREHNCMYLVALEKLAGLLPEITFLASRGLNGGPLHLGNTAVSLHLVYKGGKFSSPVSDKNKKQKPKKKRKKLSILPSQMSSGTHLICWENWVFIQTENSVSEDDFMGEKTTTHCLERGKTRYGKCKICAKYSLLNVSLTEDFDDLENGNIHWFSLLINSFEWTMTVKDQNQLEREALMISLACN